MIVAVVVPYRATPDRIPLWVHLHERWVATGWRVTLGACEQGPWVKASAVADGVARADGDVLVIADADVWCDGLADAVAAVERSAKWAVPHARILRLSDRATTAVLAGGPMAGALEVPPHPAVPGGGITVVRRDVYEACPMPSLPRREDEAWGVALTRKFGRPWRGTADLFHLWHERSPDG